ncbi:hypothetical protein MKX03_010783 [Papaver bracteatum]|nr:hypothetical protein MKX03_010783 [Papaver bracteatum]
MNSALLHFPPNSTDTKMFQDFDSKSDGNETPKSGNDTAGSSPQVKSNGGMSINSWLISVHSCFQNSL